MKKHLLTIMFILWSLEAFAGGYCGAILSGVSQRVSIDRFRFNIEMDGQQISAYSEAISTVVSKPPSHSNGFRTKSRLANDLSEILKPYFTEGEIAYLVRGIGFEGIWESRKGEIFIKILDESNYPNQISEAQKEAIYELFEQSSRDIEWSYKEYLTAFFGHSIILDYIEKLVGRGDYSTTRVVSSFLPLLNLIQNSTISPPNSEELMGFQLALELRTSSGISFRDRELAGLYLEYFGYSNNESNEIVRFLSMSDSEWIDEVKSFAEDLTDREIKQLFKEFDFSLSEAGFDSNGKLVPESDIDDVDFF